MNGAPFRAPRFFLAGLGQSHVGPTRETCMSKHRSVRFPGAVLEE
jgi:hypothetical protein